MPEQDDDHWVAVEEAVELLVEGNFEEALVALRQVIELNAKNPYAFHYLGSALYELGRLDAARDAYRAAVRLAPSYLGARLALCHTLRLLGEGESSVAEAKETLRRFPTDGDAIHAVGLAYLAKGELDPAKKYLTAFLQTGPEPEVQLEVIAMLSALEQDEEQTN